MTSRDASNRLQFLWNASHTLLSTVPSLSAFYMQQFNQFAGEKELNLAEAVKRKYCSYCGSIFLPGLNSQIRIEKNKRREKRRKLVVDNVNNTNDGNKKVISDHDLVVQLEESNVFKQIINEKSPRGKRQIIHINPRSTTSISLSNNQKQTHVRRQQYKNHISYICNSCNRETRFAGSTKKVINQISSPSDDKQRKEEHPFNVTTPIIPQVSNLYKTSTSTNPFISAQDKLPPYKTKNTKKKQKKMQLQQLLAKEKRKGSGKDDFNDSSDGLNLSNFLSAQKKRLIFFSLSIFLISLWRIYLLFRGCSFTLKFHIDTFSVTLYVMLRFLCCVVIIRIRVSFSHRILNVSSTSLGRNCYSITLNFIATPNTLDVNLGIRHSC